MILALVWLAWALSWGVAALWAAPTVQRPEGQTLYRLLTFAGFLLLIDPRRRPPLWHLSLSWQWAMVVLAALGFCLCWWARQHLGRLWSASITRKQDHRVVDSGPYRLVRHPIYTGLTVAGFASAWCGARRCRWRARCFSPSPGISKRGWRSVSCAPNWVQRPMTPMPPAFQC